MTMLYGLKSDPSAKIPASDMEEFFLQGMQQMGFKSAKDVLHPQFLSGESAQIFNTKAGSSGRRAQFAQTGNGIQIQSTTVAVTDLLYEVGTVMDPGAFFSHYCPDVMSQAVEVIVETVDKITGAQQARKPGQPMPPVQKVGNTRASFTPGYYGEKIVVDEQDILALRQIGGNNFGIRGIAQYLAIWNQQLAVRHYTLKQLLLQQTIFTGSYSWNGQNFNFGVPMGNTLVPISGQPWATLQGSPAYLQTNQNAKPLTDIRYMISNDPNIRRLKPYIKGIVMNRNTHTWFYTNQQVQELIQYGYMANPDIIRKEPRGVTMEGMIEYFLGGDIKVAVFVDDATYIADGTDPVGNPAGSVNYFIPDGQVLLVYDLASYGGQTVDFVYTPCIQTGGSYLDARPGVFMAMEDLTQPGTFGGLEFPSIKMLCGFNGMPRIKRPNDLFVMNTLA